jgi:hypothetical protein
MRALIAHIETLFSISVYIVIKKEGDGSVKVFISSPRNARQGSRAWCTGWRGIWSGRSRLTVLSGTQLLYTFVCNIALCSGAIDQPASFRFIFHTFFS